MFGLTAAALAWAGGAALVILAFLGVTRVVWARHRRACLTWKHWRNAGSRARLDVYGGGRLTKPVPTRAQQLACVVWGSPYREGRRFP